MLFNLKVLIYLEVLLVVGLAGYRAALLPRFRGMVAVKSAALILLTPAVALIGGNIYVFHAFLICAVAFTSRTRIELCGTYLLMLPTVPALQLDLFVGGTYLLAVSSFTSMNLGAVIGMLLTRRRVRRADQLLDLSVAVLLFIFVYIAARDVSATDVLRVLVQTALLLIPPYLLASRSAADADDVRRLLLYLGLAACLGSVVAIFGAVRRWDLYEPLLAALDVQLQMGSSAMAIRGGLMRMGGPFADYSAFGLFLAAVLSVQPALRSAFGRLGFTAVSTLLLIGLFATQSRGAWLGLLAGYAASLALRGRAMQAAVLVGVAGLGYGLAGAVLAPTSRLGETLGTTGGGTETSEYRRLLLSRGLEQVAQHPLSGQSPSRLIANLPDLMQGQHIVDFVNSHLYVAMAAGVPAFLAWIAIWTGAVWRLARRRHRGSEGVQRSGILTAPAAAIVSASTALTFTSAIDRNLFWSLLALGLATPALVPAAIRHRREGGQPAVTYAGAPA